MRARVSARGCTHTAKLTFTTGWKERYAAAVVRSGAEERPECSVRLAEERYYHGRRNQKGVAKALRCASSHGRTPWLTDQEP